jgi:molybdate transport system substrate-binding protein
MPLRKTFGWARWARALAVCATVLFHGPAMSVEPLRVAAASSLAEALNEVGAGFTRATGTPVKTMLGGSNVLARQLMAGAPADVFLSADASKMDVVEEAGLVGGGTRIDLWSNRLVLVVPESSDRKAMSAEDLAAPGMKRWVSGDPRAVPVGMYARGYFEKLGLWEAVAPKLVVVENVRAALAAVESGNVEVGLVYRSDALISSKVRVVLEIPESETPKIVYPGAVLKSAADANRAREFLAYLQRPESGRVFEKHGFVVLPRVEGGR